MTLPRVYLHFDGVAREALSFYQEVFGGDLETHSFGDFGRSDGPADAVAHGTLRGTVVLSGADVAGDERPVAVQGLMLDLLGAAEPAVLHEWFSSLAEGGEVIDPLQVRPWGDTDGRVRDRYGLVWLIGYEGSARS